ncbi:MAG TPA: hypothetical protein VNP94_08670 [Actinomycetota bacterium]|nr:hypothetical protein [Actinomycetota bacterium]
MRGSAGVMAVVLAEAVVGGLALAFLTPLWHEVKRGFFVLLGALQAALAAAAWFAATRARVPGDAAGRWTVLLAAALAVATAAWAGILFLRRARAARAIGLASLPVAGALLVAVAAAGRQPLPLSLFQVAAGSAFLGAVLDGLLLGHWYLTDRRLGRGPIRRAATLLLAAVAAEAAAVVSGGFGAVGADPTINPLLTAGALAPWIAAGMVLATALVAGLVVAALRGERASAVQAATGFFYLAVMTAFTAEVAVKVRFLPR